MSRYFRFTGKLFIAVTLLFITQGALAQTVGGPPPPGAFVGYVHDQIVVELTDAGASQVRAGGPSANALAQVPEFAHAVRQAQVTQSVREFPTAGATSTRAVDRRLARMYSVRFNGNLEAALRVFSNHPLVRHAEPIGIHTVSAVPNDTYFANPPASFQYDQWHYRTPYGIDAETAWGTETGDPNVVAAVLDTGVRYWHRDLGGPNAPWGPDTPKTNGNIWVNGAETPGNGSDDDGNGYVDDTVGYDFVSDTTAFLTSCIDADCSGSDNDPSDGDGHGTHLAGTIAAITNNARAVAGVAGGFSDGTTSGAGNGVKVMPLRIGWHALYQGQETGVLRMDYAAQAMWYVATMVDHGVNVAAVNCSWTSSNSGGIDAAVDALLARDVMVIHAAGNANANDPGYLGNKAGVMNVGATDVNGDVASFSNFGSWIDLAAPGVDIISTFADPDDPTNDYVAVLSGTSMSTPHAVGVAALLESYNPALTGADKFALMVNTTIPHFGTKYVGSGILNANNALNAASSACGVTADFTADATRGAAPFTVSFTNGTMGSATSYAWDFGDGNGSNETSPSHTYEAPGTYTVMLTAFSVDCSDNEVKAGYITVPATPAADFNASSTSGSAPLTVQFTDTSTEMPTAWSWDFGDGGSSVLENPTHTYDMPGTYSVSLTVTNEAGSDTVTKTDLIQVNEAPAGSRADAQSDLPVSGTVAGDYTDTFVSDDSYEVLTEVETNGNPAKRRSRLDHRWVFTVAGGSSVGLVVEAHRDANTDADDFAFEYSTDNSSFTRVFTVNSGADQMYAAVLPSSLSGIVYVRVVDTDNTQGNRSLDSIFVDEMYIESSGNVNNPPQLTVTSPNNGATFSSGQTVSLSATASDTEDGDLSAWVEWTSDKDGFLGTGANVSTTLSDGAHTITASVTDSGGLPGGDSVGVTVGSVPTLIVLVVTDKASYVNNETALISVVVSDGVGLAPGVPVHVDLTTAKGRILTGDATTDFLGNAVFTYQVNSKRDGVGTYGVQVTASAPGYNDGVVTTTFEVTQ